MAVSIAGLGALGIDGGRQGECLLVLALLEAMPVNRRAFGDGRLLLDDFLLFCYNAA